ncbi:hypothetical protein GQ53DRAFT_741932 [Thozetella sp. PMI_491]|nr:hypothetical protein GQ53DRAFT_741932 [Thozetella sp. PMI_491]
MSSSRPRPCDMCRQRKTRCVKQSDQSQCILCAFHDRQCTYLRGPRNRQQLRRTVPSPASPRDVRQPEDPRTPSVDEGLGASPETKKDEPEGDSHYPSNETSLSLLNGTLGLDLDTHPEYVGPTSHREPALLDLQQHQVSLGYDYGPLEPSTWPARRLNDRNMFLICPDDGVASEERRIADCDAIENSISPMGSSLVQLYFKVVHPSFPILHKGVFLAKHEISHRLFSPPLLAAVYLIALDYHIYDASIDQELVNPGDESGQAVLEALAERTMADDLKRPKLSTLEAGLLLLQRCRIRAEASNWMFSAQMVALAQGLGLHVNCEDWDIPEWEKGLRKRLGWALYLQDRWGALIHGRPPLFNDDDWDLQPCVQADFPEPPIDEHAGPDAGLYVYTGGELFIQHTQLARILTEVMKRFYTSVATKPGGSLDRMGAVAATEMAKPLMLQLRKWHADLPDHLRLETTQPRKLSANGSLHLAYVAVEVALHRALVRLLTPSTPPELVQAVRLAARNRVQSAVSLLEGLQPEHTGAFWWGASAYQVATVGSLACLLWATSEGQDEMQWCAKKVQDLRWILRVRSKASLFMKEALKLIEQDLSSFIPAT